MKRLLFALVAGLGAAALVAAGASATGPNNEAAEYEWHLEVPNTAKSADGDTVTLTGMGEFSVRAKTASGGGAFTLTEDGLTISGTYVALEAIAFHPYGCGVFLGEPLPPGEENLCGGRLVLRVLGTVTSPAFLAGVQSEADLTIICILGDIPGSKPEENRNAAEGITLNVPGLENYNKQAGGFNVFIRQP
jgi:hypothetical protein